jgi:hypothetical protein
MVEVLGSVARVNRAVTRPFIEKKTGLKIVSEGKNFGEIVTVADVGISEALLDGSPKLGVSGLRSRYPGSFSEEQDSPERTTSLAIYEVDPLDGTGDFKKTYGSRNVIPPTTLVTKLERKNVNDPFVPVAGLIFEIVHEYVLVSDGEEVGFFAMTEDGNVERIPFNFAFGEAWWTGDSETGAMPVRLNRRESYFQYNFDLAFARFLPYDGSRVTQVRVGGAGMQALHVFRNYVVPVKPVLGQPAWSAVTAFLNLNPIDISFNCQPDWKTWDTDPAIPIATAIAKEHRRAEHGSDFCKEPFFAGDIYGNPLTANAAAPTTKDMWHRTGTVLTTSDQLSWALCSQAKRFERETKRRLLDIDY